VRACLPIHGLHMHAFQNLKNSVDQVHGRRRGFVSEWPGCMLMIGQWMAQGKRGTGQPTPDSGIPPHTYALDYACLGADTPRLTSVKWPSM
jgi:hypothetical protein